MEEIVLKLVECLCSKYGISTEEAYSMIYSEWEYVEEMVISGANEKKLCKKIAKRLLDLYMVA
ncbi:hypothetical protein [Hydrogenimonas thermophila]|uniref:Uncharacterized protein n=1 Tax=Hydrogenimonas thermophila TaxID=223786 RepID=A0A1I5KW66_9BACT|nr:hypothetical protein [Hydrogenimonas thermophila]SFO88691.1 hypothetical protein SAMN05216234_10197 [Hydrogenimonas thermophila]